MCMKQDLSAKDDEKRLDRPKLTAMDRAGIRKKIATIGLVVMVVSGLMFGFVPTNRPIASLCTEVVNSQKKLKRVLILGNSITIHGPKAEIGWHGNWGMAASAQNKDFVHLLMQRLTKADERIKVDFKNIADIERNYVNYNYASLDSLLSLRPELIVLRLSENVDSSKVTANHFEAHYGKFMDYLKAKNKKVTILNAVSFWDRQSVTSAMAAANKARHISLQLVRTLHRHYTDFVRTLFGKTWYKVGRILE